MVRFLTFVLALSVGFACSVIAPAEAQAGPSQRIVRIGENGTPHRIRVRVNQARLIELARPARDLLVSDPTRLDVVSQSATRIWIIGKQRGTVTVGITDTVTTTILTVVVRGGPRQVCDCR